MPREDRLRDRSRRARRRQRCDDDVAEFGLDAVQALEPTARGLPMSPAGPERRSFDYMRHGTIDLFAALNRQPER